MYNCRTKECFIELAQEMKKQHSTGPNEYEKCIEFLQMKEEMAGLTIENFKMPEVFPKKVSEGQIHKENGLRISVFFVPKGTEMPLHDHPGMFVLCKILKGKLMRDSYELKTSTWQFSFNQDYRNVKKHLKQGKYQSTNLPTVEAIKSTDLVQEGDIDTVTPTVNLHRFVALEDSIFFDVISPDYDNETIFLNYYEEKSGVSQNGEVLLGMKPPRPKQLENVEVDLILE